MENYRIEKPGKEDWTRLLQVWEGSVRASHHFLNEGDVDRLKQMIMDLELFGQVELSCIRDEAKTILAFMGIADGNIEMLFVDADQRGKGLGTRLLLYAINETGANKVDVNEQNEQAVEFYEKFGFKTVSRSELDGQGKPYPLLHMQLKNSSL